MSIMEPIAMIDIEQEQKTLEEAALRLEDEAPQEILRWAVERYGAGLTLACSFGMQSVVAIDMLYQMGLLDDVDVFYTDTGVLFPETHLTRLRVQNRYDFIANRNASEMSWEEQQEEFGGHLYERGIEGVNECCRLRKVVPTRMYLSDKTAWITGMRRGHNKTREQLPVVLWDESNQCAKINPMATLSDEVLWGYIKANKVPYNPLYDNGYPSIGCNTPICTRPVKEGDDPRAGRWAGLEKTECGIHVDGKKINSLDSSHL